MPKSESVEEIAETVELLDRTLDTSMHADVRLALRHFELWGFEGRRLAMAAGFAVLACQLVEEGWNAVETERALRDLLKARDSAIRACRA